CLPGSSMIDARVSRSPTEIPSAANVSKLMPLSRPWAEGGQQAPMLSRRQHQRLNWRLRLATPAANLQQIVFLWLNIYQPFVARGLPHWYGRSPPPAQIFAI